MNLNIGDRVTVVYNDKYLQLLVGRKGTVKNPYSNDSIAVKLDGINNERSSYGYFYFEAKHLKKLNEGDEKIMEGNYTIAHVKFLEGTNTDKTYKYALYDTTISVDDICVVKSAHHGFGLAKVVDIGPKTDEVITREIVCKADFSEYYAREAARKRKAELGRLMRARAAALQETALFAMLAKDDAEMQQLLSEYNGLGAV